MTTLPDASIGQGVKRRATWTIQPVRDLLGDSSSNYPVESVTACRVNATCIGGFLPLSRLRVLPASRGYLWNLRMQPLPEESQDWRARYIAPVINYTHIGNVIDSSNATANPFTRCNSENVTSASMIRGRSRIPKLLHWSTSLVLIISILATLHV